MQFIRPFKNFDPINGELHKRTPPVIRHYLKLAREILVNRNYDEIEYAISTISYLLGGGRELLTNSNNEKITSNKEIETISIEEIHDQLSRESGYFPPSSWLYGIYCKFDIEIANQEDFPNAKWDEYFAVLALAEIAELHETDYSLLDIAELSSKSAEIAEAIAHANMFVQLREPDSRTSRGILSLNASKGGIRSNKAFNDIKSEYVVWFEDEYCVGKSNSEINFSEAAKEFYSLEIVPLINDDHTHPLAAQKPINALRMLESALRKHRKLHNAV